MLDHLSLIKKRLKYDTFSASSRPSVTLIVAPPATGKTDYMQKNKIDEQTLYIIPDNFRMLDPNINVSNYQKYEVNATPKMGVTLSQLAVGIINDKKSFVWEDPFIEDNATLLLSDAKKNGYETKLVHLCDNHVVNGFLSQSRVIDFLNKGDFPRYVDKEQIDLNVYNIHKELHNLRGLKLVDSYELYAFDYQNKGVGVSRTLDLVTKDINEWQTYYNKIQETLSPAQYRFVKELTKKIDAHYSSAQANRSFEPDWVKIKAHFNRLFEQKYRPQLEQNMEYINLAIVGTRRFEDYETFAKEVDAYVAQNNLSVMKIVSGGAKGTDSLARRYADERNIEMQEFLPETKKHGVAAFHIRNKEIVSHSDKVLAFWAPGSKGTESSLRFAKQLKKPVTLIDVGATETLFTQKPKTFEQTLKELDVSRLPSFENPIATFVTTGKAFLQDFGASQKKEYSFYLEHTMLVKYHPEFKGEVEEIMKREDYIKGVKALINRLIEQRKPITFVSTFVGEAFEKNLREKGYSLDHKQLYLSSYEDKSFQAVEKAYTSEVFVPKYVKNKDNKIEVSFEKIEAFDPQKDKERVFSVDFFLANKDKNPKMNYEIMNNKECFSFFNQSLGRSISIEEVLRDYENSKIIRNDSSLRSMVFKVDGAENVVIDRTANRWFERGDGDTKSKGLIDLAMKKPFLFDEQIQGELGFADAKNLLLDYYLNKDTKSFEEKARFYEAAKRDFEFEREKFGDLNPKGFNYLTKKRGLEVGTFTKTSDIVSSIENPKEVCFLYKSSEGSVVGVEKVNTETGAKAMLSGSQKADGLFFKVASNEEVIKNVYVCETVLDALSFEQLYLKDKKEYLIVATGGQVASKQGAVLSQTIASLAHKFDAKPQIFDCFDNDLAGGKNAERFQSSLERPFTATLRSRQKDWNEDLKANVRVSEVERLVESSVKRVERLNEALGFDDKATFQER